MLTILSAVSGPCKRLGHMPTVAAVLSIAAAVVHLWVMPKHFEAHAWWGYETFFLAVVAFQAFYAVVLLQQPRSGTFLLGIGANLSLIAIYVITRTFGIPLFGPHVGNVEANIPRDLVVKGAEVTLIVALLASWRQRALVNAEEAPTVLR